MVEPRELVSQIEWAVLYININLSLAVRDADEMEGGSHTPSSPILVPWRRYKT